MAIKKALGGGVLFPGILLLFVGCQDVFTASVFAWAAGDPANLSGERLVSYAKSILATGDTKAIEAAYEAIAETLPNTAEEDPNLYLLASELSFGKAGVDEAVVQALELRANSQEGEDGKALVDTADVKEIASTVDSEALSDAIDHFSAVNDLQDSSETISDAQYTNAAVASLVLAYSELGEGETLNKENERVKDAEEWAEAAGYDLTTLPFDF